MIWSKLADAEKFYVAFIILSALIVIGKRFTSKNTWEIWGVNTMLFTAILYYCIAGPLISIYNDDFYLRLVNHRAYYELGWKGASFFIVAYLLGYQISKHKKTVDSNIDSMDAVVSKKQLYWLFGLGVFTVFLLQGLGIFSTLSFWESNQDIESIYAGGSFRGYLLNGMNFLIAATPFIVLLWQKGKIKTPVAMALLFTAFAIFSAAGFRWRLVVSVFAGLGVYYISKNKKVKLLPVIILATAFIAYMGLLEVSRSYGRGLDLSRSENNTFQDNLLLGFNEAAVFQATGYVMSKTGEKFDYIGFKPIVESIVTPIPRALWPGKPTGSYISNITDAYSVNGRKLGLGQAVLNYGEYYMAYGWWGIIFYAFGLGLLIAWLEKIALRKLNNPWMLCFYVLSSAYMYVIFSRGYMPQQVMFFFFTAFPALYLAKRYDKKLLKA